MNVREAAAVLVILDRSLLTDRVSKLPHVKLDLILTDIDDI
jgi:hypothetical protein